MATGPQQAAHVTEQAGDLPGFLACISLMPLVTEVMDEYAVSPAVIACAVVMMLAALSELALWLHAERHGLVADAERATRRAGAEMSMPAARWTGRAAGMP